MDSVRATDDDLLAYKSAVDHNLKKLSIPEEGFNCNSYKCADRLRIHSIDSCNDVRSCLIAAAKVTIPKLKAKNVTSHNGQK